MSHTISSPTNTFDAAVRAIRVAADAIADGYDGTEWVDTARERVESYSPTATAAAENLAAAAVAAANDLDELKLHAAANVARGIERGARADARARRAARR